MPVAITAVNLSYVGNGPTASGQIINDGTSGPKSKTLIGYGTATLTTDATTFPVNFIDGTKTLPAVPAAVFITRSGNSGDSAGAAAITLIPSALSNTGFTATMSAVGTTAGATLSFGVVIAFSS